MPYVHSLAVAAFIFALSTTVTSANAPAHPRRSAVPCAFVCPPEDAGGFALGFNSDDGATLFCSYPITPDEDPNDFFCRYSDVSGVDSACLGARIVY